MFAKQAGKLGLALGCVGLMIGDAGCRTDGLHRRRVPNGPVLMAPSHPPRIGSSRESLDTVIADAQEVDFVEAVLANRAKYHRSLEQLRSYYETRGYSTKQHWAAFELEGLRSVKAFRYLTDSEIAPETLRPMQSIKEADALYDQGVDLMRRGGYGVPGLYRRELMIQAADVFGDLVERYPDSDKIDDAAFMNGEIHKEYFSDQEPIAVKWYERAWTWNPKTPHPARFQAAVVYDFRLHDRDRALELYQQVLTEETKNKSNVHFATRRIRQLTQGRNTERAPTRVTRASEP